MVRALLFATGAATLILSVASAINRPYARRHDVVAKHRAAYINSPCDDISGGSGCSSSSNTSDSTDDGSTAGGAFSGASSSLEALFPSSGISGAWTVAPKGVPESHVLNFTDDTFIVQKEIKNLKHPVISIDGKKALHGHMNQGAYDLQSEPAGGFSFYSPGPKGPNGDLLLDIKKAREVSFSYSVKFSEGYAFNRGGKLPGLYGGVDEDTAATCSGGRHSDGCFSTRFMFRAGGKGELYLYIPPSLNRATLCGSTGTSKCRAPSSNGKTYGASVGTGLWHFKPGEFRTVRQVVHLNTPGSKDGWVKVYVNGSVQPILDVTALAFRSTKESTFRGLQVQYFHGGHAPSWAAPVAQDAWFSEFTVAITETDE